MIDKDTNVIKNLTSRISQLGLIALIVSAAVTCYYISLGLKVSAVMVAAFLTVISVILILQYFRIIKQPQTIILVLICALFITSSFIEGAGTGQYLYFFPVLVLIPIIVDYKNISNIGYAATYAGVFISFATCFLVGYNTLPLEIIPLATTRKMLYGNAGAAIMLTILFSIAYVFYEKRHLRAILIEKNGAIKARTKFLSTMAHELRTPLNGIIGTLSLIESERSMISEDQYFNILKYCSNHMQQLINDVLDFNKIEADKLVLNPIETNLKALVINSTLPFYNHIKEKGLKLITAIDDQIDTTVLVDDIRLIQVLNNLISNAMKFTETGKIKVSAIVLKKNQQGLTVELSVEDTGTGIRKEDQQKIFESFEQIHNDKARKYSGSGLGLSISLTLIRLMGSTLQVRSEFGEGSVFSFILDLPLIGNVSKADSSKIESEVDLSSLNVLVVDDNAINRLLVEKMLKAKKAICYNAGNGVEALEALKTYSNINFILLDLEMPVMDGYTAITKITALYPETPVFAFTAALVDTDMLTKLQGIGFSDYLSKPFQPNQMFEKIKKVIALDHNEND